MVYGLDSHTVVLAKTVCRFVAAGCSNTHKDGVHLFHFPKDARLKKKWTDQVRRTRDKWQPAEHSVLAVSILKLIALNQV